MTLPATELSRMLEAAVVAARLAGQHAMEQLQYLHRTIKNGTELVTQADPACQKIIIDHIRQTWPDHGFIGEEGTDGNLLKITPRGDESIWWVIDPIDGTNNYANKLLCFCVCIAAFYKGKPVVSVIFDPATDSVYRTAEGMDAQLNNSTITVSDAPINRFASFGVDSHHGELVDAGLAKMMELTRFRCLGSTALHMAYVAGGAMIGMATAGAKLWDIAAGTLLIERAGGKVTDPLGNTLFPVDLDSYNAEQFPILATNKINNSQIIDIFSKKE